MKRLENKIAMIRGSAFAVRMDVTDQESIDGAVSEVTSRVGGSSTFSLATPPCSTSHPSSRSHGSCNRLFAIDVAGTLFRLQAAAKIMIKQGRRGRIINMQKRKRSKQQ